MSRLKLLLLVLYVATIFAVSTRPNLSPPGPDFEYRDKVAHVVEYFLLGTLLFSGIGWTVSRTNVVLVFFFLLSVGVSIGAIDEMVQGYIPGRHTDIFDWMADASGVGLGVALTMTWSLHRRRASRERM